MNINESASNWIFINSKCQRFLLLVPGWIQNSQESNFFSALCPRAVRFWTTKVAKQTKRNLYQNRHFMEFSFNCIVNLINLVIFYFALWWVFLLLTNEIDNFFSCVSRPYGIQRQFCFYFSKLVCFFAWLVGTFLSFELTLNGGGGG
jgi:hypothetical protein